MSRVEDDRDAARMAAKLAEAKRTEEAQKNKKATENNAFSKLMQGQKKEAAQAQEGNLARSAIAQLLEQAETQHAGEARHTQEKGAQGTQQESAFKGKLGTKQQESNVQQKTRNEGQQVQSGRSDAQQSTAQTANSRQADQSGNSKAAQSRGADSKANVERLEERKEASDANSSNATQGASGARGEKGDIKADADKGGGQQGGGDKGKDGNSAAANPGFRFNPALMQPVPVSKTKEASGSDRLRKVANEVAQKIVDKVRVGTNAMGRSEFQIDLKSDVLSGLSVKVSAHNGKISAVFQGSDKDVLKMIEEQGEALKAALGARGLSLEDFKIEAR
ncbi:MAG: flagellar hook-length control protein FliK [Archangium sp.]|nr:flagellar hook-length control protein FliK [Archangium sp.]